MKLLVIMGLIFSMSAMSEVDQLRSLSNTFSKIAKSASPAVVFIETTVQSRQVNRRDPRDLFGPFFGHPGFPGGRGAPPEEAHGQGSGFVISSDGLILTNNHVVKDATEVIVHFYNKKKVKAKVIGTDRHTDIALLKVDLDNLPTLKLANSKKVEVGEWVIALGSPFGLSHSLTAGIVSATGRNSVGISNYENFIQTDAAINPGNSGGPLINLDGEVVGMNTAIFSRSGGYMGIGFAIPSNMISDIKTQLYEKGEVQRGYLGVAIASDEETKGIIVSAVSEIGPAQKSGLRAGDIITSFDGIKTEDIAEFRNLVAKTRPNSKATLEIKRNGVKRELSVRIGELPNQI